MYQWNKVTYSVLMVLISYLHYSNYFLPLLKNSVQNAATVYLYAITNKMYFVTKSFFKQQYEEIS